MRPNGGEPPAIVEEPGLPEPGHADASIDLTFDEAFDGLYARAYGVAFQLIGSRPEAEDIAQETLARAYVRWRKVRDDAGPWAVRVAGNLSIVPTSPPYPAPYPYTQYPPPATTATTTPPPTATTTPTGP
jgi:hypothetical protein